LNKSHTEKYVLFLSFSAKSCYDFFTKVQKLVQKPCYGFLNRATILADSQTSILSQFSIILHLDSKLVMMPI